MKSRFLHFLGVEPGEESMVSLLLTQSVFLGLFYGAFDISAHSLFLAVFDETIMARAYVISGLSGIVLTSVYSFFQSRMKFRNFSIVNLAFITAVTLFMWVLLILFTSKLVIFIVFVMMGPLNIMAMLGFWGTTGRLFSLRQGKRLFSLVDTGQVIGIIVSSYAIPVLLTFGFNTHNIILLSAGAIFGAAYLQISLGKFKLLHETGAERKGSVKTAFSMFRNDSYVRSMGMFIAVSVMAAFFIQYSFMAVTREQYPLEADMAKFLGLFTGSMMIFTLFLKTFLFSYLIRTYGLRVILLLSPVLLVMFTSIAAVIGATMGFSPGTGGFLLFFLLLALSRLFSKALKDSAESPSFKVIYQTLDEKVRYGIQSMVDGTVNEFAALISGLLLAGLGIIVAGSLIHFSWVLLIITIIWVYLGYKLYAEYRRGIVKSLEQTNNPIVTLAGQNDSSGQIGYFHAEMLIRRNYLRFLNKDYILPDTRFDREIIDSIKAGSPLAQELISSDRSPQVSVLLRLLRENNIDSKRAALLAIGKFHMIEMIPEVCESIGKQGVALEAVAVLDSFGADASAELIRSFLKNSGNIVVSRQILDILGRNCFHGSRSMIFQMLWASSKIIKEQAADILLREEFRAIAHERDKIHQLISEVIGIILWHSGANIVLKKSGNKDLRVPLDSDRDWWTRFLFKLLAITYDRNYVEKINENLAIGTVESVNFAIEMIDIVLEESIKSRVSFTVDITPDEEKLKLLNQFYPVYISDYDDLLIEIINRDYNLTGLWAKAIAIGCIPTNVAENFEMTLLSLLFSPERILLEEAARAVKGWEGGDIAPVLKRIPPENSKIAIGIIDGSAPEEELMVSKVRFLHSILPEVDENSLIPLAAALTVEKDETPGRNVENDLFAWEPLSSDTTPAGKFYRAGDSLKPLNSNNKYYYTLSSGDLMSFLVANDNLKSTITRLTDSIES